MASPRLIALAAGLSLVAGAVTATQPARAVGPHWQAAQTEHKLGARDFTPPSAPPPSLDALAVRFDGKAASVPAGGRGRLETAASSAAMDIGGVRLLARPAKDGDPPAGWSVSVADPATADHLTSGGVVVQVAPEDPAAPGAALTVDYGQLAEGHDADWADRLHVVALTDCPSLAADCPNRTVLPSTNDTKAQRLTVSLPGATATTLAIEAAAAGSTGSYSATSLSRSASWQAGDASGAFNWSYPLKVPPTQGGPAPQLTLSYNSTGRPRRRTTSRPGPVRASSSATTTSSAGTGGVPRTASRMSATCAGTTTMPPLSFMDSPMSWCTTRPPSCGI
jgi:hypothetical protein